MNTASPEGSDEAPVSGQINIRYTPGHEALFAKQLPQKWTEPLQRRMVLGMGSL